MKLNPLFCGVLAAGYLILPRPASAQVDTNAFNALEKKVDQLGNKVEKLEQTHEQDQKTHEQDQKIHEADQKKAEDLQRQLNETRTAVTNVTQKTEEVARVQSAYPAANTGMGALHNFSMVGDAEVQYGKTAGTNNGFALADFAPIFLYRAGDDVLFEAGFDFMLQNNGQAAAGTAGGGGQTTAFDLSFAQLDYLWNDYVTVVAGYMLLPLGTYSERSAGWLNKFPDAPLPRAVVPGAGPGVQLRGSVPVGDSGQMITYSVYGANGPGSRDGTGTALNADGANNIDLAGNVGLNSGAPLASTHSSISGGGRIGWFYPWQAHTDLELGLSGQSGTWDNMDTRLWSSVVFDAALHVTPNFEAKGEYLYTMQETSDMGTLKPRGWWLQAGYKLAGLNLDFPYVNNLELVGRYDYLDDGLGTKTDRYTMGYVYYFSNTLWFEGDYEFIRGRAPNATAPNSFVFQLSYGF